MSSTDEVIAKARETLERTSMQYQAGPGRRARENDMAKRVTRAAVADLAIIGVAVTLGLVVGPIGIIGFFLMVVAMLIATAVLLATPASAPPTFERLRQTDLKALPAQTGRWLDAQRPALPAPAISVVDQIGLKLDALTPQLATLDDDAPAAAEIRKLVGEQLPEFIKGYERVPQALRNVPRNGKTPDQQLVDGLKVIGGQIDEMAGQLAQGDLDSLQTQGRFLEIKYQGDTAGV
ncbi:MAG: hypothetical protein E7773_04515 [Sphingomonas sp.]|uniref:hypothetical protein n=1 Tax=Sphingomonas sp. TaxID=28214 RepID=UPI00120E9440|nr:hypothetical protein [Sphingomonas sp.]THD37298.1 MAG: hypothetical protein E7773_04515 [Sphingomonas sp.]